MDPDFVRAILCSSGQFNETIKYEELDQLVEKVPAVDARTITALSKSLADSICYKISPEAHIKYSVRLQLIDILRDWLHPPLGLGDHRPFCQSENILELSKTIIIKYLQKKKLCDDNATPEQLITLIRSLMNIASINPIYAQYLKLIIKQITELEVAANYKLVQFILSNEKEINLEFSAVEDLIICQREKIIEEPIVDCFISNINSQDQFRTTESFDKLMKKTAYSPKIFQVVCSLLGKLCAQLQFSSFVLVFIQFILKTIVSLRDDEEKNLLNLYPINLQSHVILLRIEPRFSTENSNKYLLESLRKIYSEDKEQILILITHFPKWLDELVLFL
ncbi:GSCOCG00003929001-RA-CDS [Cotesia congregata]|uniref:Uncharacterized protein n=1 Tax=Cotesia congregata TaxID=51543 RepID=A0A8J2H5U7_COTCN|nr:GSCOCG00003929001-RA-CDS [Cotesia congregata]CAG5076512.1 Protein of unknown function [Cotesia congregata]